MNLLKRMRPNSPWLLTCAISAMISVSAQAGIVVPKPAFTFPSGVGPLVFVESPEMGHILARSGTYTLAGTPLESRPDTPSEYFMHAADQKQGVVYLFNGATATPERIYQFPGISHRSDFAGFRVAISNAQLAFAVSPTYNGTTINGTPILHTARAYVYVGTKTNSVWPSCPTLNSFANNCNNSYRENGSASSAPLTRISFGTAQRDSSGQVTNGLNTEYFSLAISDNYLVLADAKTSHVQFYRYDTNSKNWILEYNVDDEDYKTFGRAVAISGDRIAVSSTWEGNTASSRGMVRIYQRNASNGTWSMSSQVDADYGINGTGNFGHSIQMDSNTLVVASGATSANGEGVRQLKFFLLNSQGIPTFESQTMDVPKLNKISLSDNNLAVSHAGVNPAVTIYSRNTTSSTFNWTRTAGLTGNFYDDRSNITSGLAPFSGQDDIALVNDDLSIGWRTFKSEPDPRFMGAVVHEKVSQLDSCRSTKNLVANCSFDNVTNNSLNSNASGANWTLLNHNGGSGSVSYTDRQMKVSVYSPGYDMWHIQARTPVNLSQAVKYKLSFRAKADSNRTFVVNIGHNGNQDNNWQSYGRETIYATTNWTEYSYEFQMPMDSNAFLDFNFGNAGTSAVTVDGVSLTAI